MISICSFGSFAHVRSWFCLIIWYFSCFVTVVCSYYILQIIEEDKGSECYVFRKWGRVGNEKIGGNKLEEMSKSDAIQEFKRLFLEKTGNSWEAWEQKTNFQKQPGRFYPLDIVSHLLSPHVFKHFAHFGLYPWDAFIITSYFLLLLYYRNVKYLPPSAQIFKMIYIVGLWG